MPQQLVDIRPTCSHCCRPFTEEDPGYLAETHKYLVSVISPVSDPSKPTCVVVQLAPDLILCKASCRGVGFQLSEEIREIQPRKRRGRKQETDPIQDKRIWDAMLRLDWIPTWGCDPIPSVDSDADPFDRSNLLI